MTTFFDTNILLYAASSDAKRQLANECLARRGLASVQVLNEFIHVARRKLGHDWPQIELALGLFRASLDDVVPVTLNTHAGAIVIAGTGSVGRGFGEGRELRVGGYGFPISDEGSGAHLGLKAVQMALRGHDGRHERTALLAEVMQRCEGDPMAAVAWMDRASATDYAALAPMVMRHADQGDPAGRRIVQNAAEQIDTLVRVLFEKGAPRVTLLGGLASPLEPWLSPDVRRRLKPADGDAVSGAIILAKRSPRLL